MSAINRIALLLFVSLIVAALFWLRAFDSYEYASLTALNRQQKTEGFVPVGRFGESWPASIVEVREQDDRIEFTRSNGQPHVYQGFEGYRLRVVRLESRSGEEVIVVYRSDPVASSPTKEIDDKPIVRRI